MNNDYTKLSHEQLENLKLRDISPSQVVDYFYNDFPVRKFNEDLVYLYDGERLDNVLLDGVFEFRSCFAVKPPVRDNVRRTIANWINGGSVPNAREDLISICFALRLHAEDADMFLRRYADSGFHIREPRDAALFYCLKSEKIISESAAFIKGLDLSFPTSRKSTDNPDILTEIVAEQFNSVSTDEDFLSFLDNNREAFGKLHNTAFLYFDKYYTVLSNPASINGYTPGEYTNESNDASFGKERLDERKSVESVVGEYLRMNIPVNRKLNGLNVIQKGIREYWLGETSVKRILERTEDVSRKSLLLLYIATQGERTDMENAYKKRDNDPAHKHWDLDWLYYGYDLDPADYLENHRIELDIMLKECGFSRLDPRNPFDWLILYSLRIDDNKEQVMSDRLKRVTERLFPEQK